MNGFLIANKPTGITSSNLVVFVRKRLPQGTAIGHGGTLDPEASGVLPGIDSSSIPAGIPGTGTDRSSARV